ncbi:MAG: T9SS type A sorting domain-containing protein [Bacteroidota bacterium]
MLTRLFLVVVLIGESLEGSSQIVDTTFNSLLKTTYVELLWEDFKVGPNNRLYIKSNFDFVQGDYFANEYLRFNEDLTPDMSYTPEFEGAIFGFQKSGKAIVATRTAAPGSYLISRYEMDGTKDISFNEVFINGLLDAAHVEKNDHIVIVGRFDRVNDEPYSGIVRLNEEGTIKSEFNPGKVIVFNSAFKGVISQSDGKIIIMGASEYGGVSVQNLFRIDLEGSIDDSFNYMDDGELRNIQVLEDDRIALGGDFSRVNDREVIDFVRLLPDGEIDSTFIPPPFIDDPNVQTKVNSFDIDSSSIIVGGKILLPGSLEVDLIRLNPDGSIDNSFKPVLTNGFIHNVHKSNDGIIVFDGSFTEVLEKKQSGLSFIDSNGEIIDDLDLNLESLVELDQIIKLDSGQILVRAPSNITVNDRSAGSIFIINKDGSLLEDFLPISQDEGFTTHFAKVADDFLIGGAFDYFNIGLPFSYGLMSITSDGSVNDTFAHPFSNQTIVWDIDVVNDAIYVSGDIYDEKQGISQIAKLDLNGNRDYQLNGRLVDPDSGFGDLRNLLPLNSGDFLATGTFQPDKNKDEWFNACILDSELTIKKILDLEYSPQSLFKVNEELIALVGLAIYRFEQKEVNGILVLNQDGSRYEDFNFVPRTNEKVIAADFDDSNYFTILSWIGDNSVLSRIDLQGNVDISVQIPNTLLSNLKKYDSNKYLITGKFYGLEGLNNSGIALVSLSQFPPTASDIDTTVVSNSIFPIASSIEKSYYDPNFDPLVHFTYTSEVTNAKLLLNDQELSTGQNVEYSNLKNLVVIPESDFVGQVSFDFELADAFGTSNSAKYTINVIQEEITALDEHNQWFNAYPNPFQDVINVATLGHDVKSIRITTSSGKVVFTGGSKTKAINSESFPKGLYIMNIYTEKDQFNLRLVKH